MQHERQPLGRGQRLEDHEHGHADGIGQQHEALRVTTIRGGHDRVGQVDAHRLLASRVPDPQRVEREAGHDGGEPATQVVDRGGVTSVQAEPGVLDRVLGFGRRPKHPIRHGPQVRAMELELLGEPVAIRHWSRSPRRLRQPVDERKQQERDRGTQ